MEVIEDSLRISQRTHLFNWLQGGVQCLIGHEVMIFGIKSSEEEPYEFEYFTSSRYFGETQFNEVVKKEGGLVDQAIKERLKTAAPIFVTNQFKPADYNKFSVIAFAEAELKASELNSFVVHGFGDRHSKISTVVIFARLSKQLNAHYAYALELIMPHLHCALINVMTNRSNAQNGPNRIAKKITKREAEVLQWVHMGKTNWEISSILSVSPLTVKNHVQNILRKLDVQNRGQAAIKASKLGLVKVLK